MWILDAYTTTDRYPYAQPDRGAWNYIRNSIKVTVDASRRYRDLLRRSTTQDPLIRAWARAFPGALHPLFDKMPADLKLHVRYPEDLFSLQARMYAHLSHAGPAGLLQQGRPVNHPPPDHGRAGPAKWSRTSPFMRLPGGKQEEFVLLSGFSTPARRDNMIAYHGRAVRCAQLRRARPSTTLPKQKLVYGPRQIDARVNQDPVISSQFSLWNQQGFTGAPGLRCSPFPSRIR